MDKKLKKEVLKSYKHLIYFIDTDLMLHHCLHCEDYDEDGFRFYWNVNKDGEWYKLR